MKTRICLAGAAGNVGRELVKGIAASADLELAACMGRSTAGRRLPEVLPFACPDLHIHASVDAALEAAAFDVLIDYTTPAAVYATISRAIERGIACVVGSSGLSDDQYALLNARALERGIGLFAAGNFSITAALMAHFARIAARYVPHWELFDYGPDTKVDAPSGTTLELAQLLAEIAEPDFAVAPETVHGDAKSRGAKVHGSQIHSVRLPGFDFAAEALFGLPGERISIRHEAISSAPYVAGTLMAARKVLSMRGLVRGMSGLLGLES